MRERDYNDNGDSKALSEHFARQHAICARGLRRADLLPAKWDGTWNGRRLCDPSKHRGVRRRQEGGERSGRRPVDVWRTFNAV